MIKKKIRLGIIPQVALLFTIGVFAMGILTYFTQLYYSQSTVRSEVEKHAERVGREVEASIREYPTYEWLLRYWHDHYDELDIEYDAKYIKGTRTERKCKKWRNLHPDILLKYATVSDISNLPPEDQKLYAEIIYSWFITRIDQIKRTYEIDFLFCVMTDNTYETQFFLFSAADEGSKRGTNYEEIYPIGVEVTVSKSQQEAMRNALLHSEHLAHAGKYVDYYDFLSVIDDKFVLIGMTYNLSNLINEIVLNTWLGTLRAVILQVLLSMICLGLLFRFVLRPLRKVQKGIRTYKTTKDSGPVIKSLSKVHTHNEIGQLSEDIVELAREMDNYMAEIADITAEKERIETELSLAARIQSDMLPNIFPPFPERTEFDIYASMDPAKEVGGDFYDFLLLDDDHLYMVMADVSGKGIPAALFMMVSQIILGDNALSGKSPAQILEAANDIISSHNQEEMFVTVWLGILEISTGKIIASNAGHEYPVLMQPGGSFEVVKDKHGFVIGGMEGMRYRDYEIQLEPGAKLFLYTDGVPEATNAQNEMFGMDRMIEALNKDSGEEPKEVLLNVRKSVDSFVMEAEQFDDLTMMCLSYHGSKESTKPMKEITIEAKLENLYTVTAFVDEELEAMGCPMKTMMQIDLAIDETFTNIASYAYGSQTGSATIRLERDDSMPAVRLTFIDQGVAYNPLLREDPDVSLPAGERDIGGLGILLIKKSMDEISYEYKNGCNVLTMTKNL